MEKISTPKISIVIPVYNAEKYLEECIQSAINQTYPNIEVIAVDDGSTDSSLQILKKFSNKIKIIEKENGGMSSALNEGIRVMTGEWFKWLSADDVLYPNAVEVLVSEANKLKNKKNYVLFSNWEMIDSDGKILRKVVEPNYNELSQFDLNILLLDHYIGNGTTSLIHKSTLDEYGTFDGNPRFVEDYELLLRYSLLHNVRLYFISKSLAKYRIHGNQETQKRGSKKLIDQSENARKYVLDQLEPELRKKYEGGLVEYQKKNSQILKYVPFLRKIVFKIFPKSVAYKIESMYANRIGNRRI